MAVPTSIYVRPSTRVFALLDWLQMLSGVILILFMWSHLMMVSSILLGENVMNTLAEFLESYYLVHLGAPLIIFVFLLHFILAVRKVPFHTEQQTSIWHQAKMLHHQDTWLWMIQAMTAMLILIMGAAHMWAVLSDLPITAVKSAARVQNEMWLIFYLLLLPMVELHVGIGFYRIGVKWGVIKRNNRGKAKRIENFITVLFIVIGLLTLARFYFLALPPTT